MSRPSPALVQLLQSAAGADDVWLPIHVDCVEPWYHLESLRTRHPHRFQAATQYLERMLDGRSRQARLTKGGA